MARGRHPTRIHIDPPDEQIAAKYLSQWYGRDLRREPHRFPSLTSPELFGNNRPLEIDFGCGMGIFACSRAQHYPAINMLGIDQSQKPLYCALRDAAAMKLENIKFLRGNFSIMVPLLRPQTISAAFYLFPNPPRDYHKERANARRRHFLQNLHNALIPGGRLYFATDALLFFECVNDIIKNDLHLKTLDPKIADCETITRYWRMWEEQGRNVRSIVVTHDNALGHVSL
jgi:tRNA (guanine-N7-)-methyltransferase